MKGIIFKNLEVFSTELLGKEGWNQLVDSLPLQTEERFFSNRTYPDTDLDLLLFETAKLADLKIEDAWRKFGRSSVIKLIEQFPQVVAPYHSFRAILEDINGMHFGSVRNLFTQTELPYLSKEEASDQDRLILRYVSKRKLCFYLEGTLEGAANFFGEPIKVSQPSCVHVNSNICKFEILFHGTTDP
jgi:hypothetical protein